MSKGRKRSKAKSAAKAAKAAAKAAGFEMPPGPRPLFPGGFCGGRPPLARPMMPGNRFPMGPPDFRPPMMDGGPFMNEPPDFGMRDQHVHRPGFDMHPRFVHPDMEDGPRGFHPEPHEGRPSGFVPSEFRDGPPGFVPPEFRDRPPDFVPPEFRDRPPDFVPPEFRDRPPDFVPPAFRDGPQEFRDRHSDFVPPEFRDRPPHFVPPEFRDRPQGFAPPEFRDRPRDFPPTEFRDGTSDFIPPAFGYGSQGFGPPAGIRQFEDGPGCHAVDPNCMHPQNAPSNAPCPPQQPSEPATEQSSASVSNENSTNSTTNTTTSASTSNKEISVVKKMLGSVKPPPGRSLGVITFISNSYGFIERDDLKKYSFSFDAFFGKRIHLVPGVKVHFTAVQELGKEFATDVKVAPRGTEEIGDTVYEGVVIAVLPETYVLEPHPGRIRSILTTEPVKLPFGKMDSKATLLLFDRVKFQLVKDIISKVRRATNITPQMPETIQLTKETREKGVIMSITPDTFTIKSKTHENLTASLNENFSHDQLKVMDEVEFTLVTAKDKMKAIRLMKLPEQPVELNSQAKNVTDSSAGKSLWKPVNSVVAAGDEDISNEKYDGTISQIIPKSSEKEMEQELPRGIVDTVVNGKQKRLPFGPGDVITQATMMVGDKVQFNIATKQQTKGQHAINIEIRLETFQRESKEQRKIGIVVKLDANSGFIKAPQNPQVCFNLSEVMDNVKLSLLEKVEFTLAAGPDEAADSKRAIRIRRLTESVFTSVPKVEEKKEKKKMTIKLLKDLKESIKTHVKTEGEDSDLLDVEKPKAIKEDNKGKDENSNKGNGERSRSRESSRRSRSRSQDKSGSYHGKRRSSSRDRSHRSYRRSRSRSRDRSRRYRRSYSHSRSRSRSRERSNRSGRKRTRSPENTHEHRKGQSQECSSSKRSKSPDDKIKTSKYAASTPSMESVNNELAMKRNELLELNELIARKKAIIAMEQNSKTPSQFKDTLYTDTEIDTQHGIATFDYQHKTYQENPWTPDMKPVRSILKKHSESLSNSQNQEIERSESIEEPEGCAQTNTSSMYTSAGSVPVWSSTAEIEDLELARKKRQLEELSESIARKRAIIAMEQKAKALSDGSEIKKKYDFGSCSDDLNITMASKNTWQLDIKPDLQPKKSILKKRTETVPDQPQKDLTSAGQYGHFPLFKQPEDDSSAFLNPSGPLDTAFKKTPSVLSSGDLFKKLLTGASISSCTSSNKAIVQQPLQPSLGLFYSQKSTRETKEQSYPASLSQFSHQDYEEASTSEGSSTQSSASNRKSNLATQMERFLGALNKADSNLLSSLLRDAKKDSDLLQNQRISHEQAARKAACDELYDPFKETDCNENSYTSPNTHDDLLPHERVVEDGSGFSKIVGMKYGSEAMPDDRYLYGEPIPSISQSRLLEEHEKFLKECDQFKSSQGRFSDETYFEESYAEDKRKKTSGRYRIEGSRSPARPKSVDANEDAAQKASHYKAIQDLLQTVGLNLDTSEVSKLDDRTKERLYGKKVKSQSSRSSDRKDGQSVSRFDKRDRSQSTDSDSVSPAKSSKREVYMSYMDSIKYRKDEAEELNLLSLKRTIRNSPDAEQQTSDPQKIAPAGVTHDPYKPIAETFSAGLPYPQMASEFSSAAHQESQQCSYAVGRQENPYGPVYYPAAYSTPPPGYQGYGASVMPLPIMPPNPSQFYPSFSSFSTPGPFGPSYYPPSLNLNGMSMQPGSSSYAPQQVKTKPTSQSRCLKTIETVKTERSVSVKLSASKEVRTVISIQTENEPKDTEDEPEMATLKEDDIKAKQKKRLEQFNQRMRLKKKQQMEAQRTRGLNQKSSPGTVMRTEVKNVWICGHSLVFWAEKRATSPEIGMQLGMDPNSVRIWWKGVQGMTWQQLLPQLLQLKDNWPNPDMILIHLGGNDIGKMTPETFVLAVKKDMISLKSIFPQCRLVWSDILPRKSWRHSDDSTNVNNMRQAINKTIHGIMLELGGVSLTHDNIMSTQDPGLYRPDGVHLSGKGIDTFNLNMQDLLERWESEICETEASES